MIAEHDGMDVDSEGEVVAQQQSNGKPYTVGVVWSAVMLSHLDSRQEHQESPARIQRIWDALLRLKYREKMLRIPIRPATEHEILLVHTVDHLDKIKEIATFTEEKIADAAEFYESLSLYVVPATTHCALMSCGGVIEATLAVARGTVKKAFAIVRPPGHHAEPNEHMGFCFLNNVAVATRVVQKVSSIRKVLILDWDVHHGNGTQRAFNDDESVLYISIHRYDDGTFYPSGPYGSLHSSGEGKGEGFSVNIPWPSAGMGDADYLLAFQKLVMPIAMEFAPDLVIISAGFDAADGDPLGECSVTPAGYAHMTHMLCGLASGKVVVALEGGYSLDAIEKSAMAVTSVLLGEPPDELPPMRASVKASETIWQVARHQSKYWKNVDPKSCEPRSDVEEISISIPELLKLHRQYDMYTQYKMLQIPLLNSEMESRYEAQVMCSQNLFESKVLVLFVHEFGNLRLELDSSLICDVHHERSYLLDISKQLIHWIREEDYSLVDVNVFSKPQPPSTGQRSQRKAERQHSVLLYVWDNYVQLSDAQSVIIIAHGPGCDPVIQLLEERTGGVKNIVRSVIQVVGKHKLKRVKDKDDLRRWYPQHSHIILPADHEMMIERDKSMRFFGALVPFPETRGVTLILKAFPTIKKVVQEQLEKPFEKVVDIF